jgi:CBS domain-containing protein
MHKGVITCPPDADLQTAAGLMASNHVHSLVVIGLSSRQEPQTLVWGALSDLDLLRATKQSDEPPTAGEIAHTRIEPVDREDPLETAVSRILELGTTQPAGGVAEPERPEFEERPEAGRVTGPESRRVLRASGRPRAAPRPHPTIGR